MPNTLQLILSSPEFILPVGFLFMVALIALFIGFSKHLALRRSEERYRTVAERATYAIFIVQDEIITYANPRFSDLLGYPLEELINTHC